MNKPRKLKIKDRVRQLKEQLEGRLEAEEKKIRHAENYSNKIVGMLGDMARKLIEIEGRVDKLERKKK